MSTTEIVKADQITDLEQYKALVRKVAIRVQHEEEWCREGLNEVLAELNLEPYRGPIYFTGTVRLTASVTAPGGTPVLTPGNVLDYVLVLTTDEDIEDTGPPKLIKLEKSGGYFLLVVEVPVRVSDCTTLRCAESWLDSSLEFDWKRQTLLFGDHEVSDIRLTEHRDPAAPEA